MTENRFNGTAKSMQPDGQLEVCFSNPELAGTTVTVTVRRENSEETESLEIELDDGGQGKSDFIIPEGWSPLDSILLQHDTSIDHPVAVS